MEEIIESIINGQRRQALDQLIRSQYVLQDLFIELLNINRPSEILTMYNIAVNYGYLTFKDELC